MDNPALAALRHHVSGAIERGEAEAIVERPVAGRCPVMGYKLTYMEQVERRALAMLNAGMGITTRYVVILVDERRGYDEEELRGCRTKRGRRWYAA